MHMIDYNKPHNKLHSNGCPAILWKASDSGFSIAGTAAVLRTRRGWIDAIATMEHSANIPLSCSTVLL